MPEGDTIHRSAMRLRPVMTGATVADAVDNGQFFDSMPLIGAKFTAVEARGKHLLMHLVDGRVIHSHMGMTGSWRLHPPSRLWPRAAIALKLHSGAYSAIAACSTPKTLEILSATQYRRHPMLQRLGPDLLTSPLDALEVVDRFRIHDRSTIGEAVLNQTIVSGVGNVYKSEVLFLERINPFVPVSAMSDETIMALTQQARSLLRKNVLGHRRQTRMRSDGQRLWVYRRNGKPCFSCTTTIRMRRQGDLGRSTYWCPSCQCVAGMPELG